MREPRPREERSLRSSRDASDRGSRVVMARPAAVAPLWRMCAAGMRLCLWLLLLLVNMITAGKSTGAVTVTEGQVTDMVMVLVILFN